MNDMLAIPILSSPEQLRLGLRLVSRSASLRRMRLRHPPMLILPAISTTQLDLISAAPFIGRTISSNIPSEACKHQNLLTTN